LNFSSKPKNIINMKNNATKTPLFETLKKALKLALYANKSNISSDEILQRREYNLISRRTFLENTGKTLLVGSLGSLGTEGGFARSFLQKDKPRIAIIGAGIAGLNALHTLKKAGFDATIYEASGRTSGRIFTVQGAMGGDTWTEFGGEFIDSNHKDMWDLTKEFNLELIDYAQASEEKLTKEAFFFEGKHRKLSDVVKEFMPLAPKIAADAARLPKTLSTEGYKTRSVFAKKIDRLSLSEYLERIGAKGWIKTFIEMAYESEYGLSPQEQSAINLPILISTDLKNGHFELFGESDERYKVRGGNQSIPDALAQKYANHIELNRSLEALNPSGMGYNLTFSGKSAPVKADFVIIAIPFTRLRNVHIGLKMPQVKWDSINTMGFGTNAKLMLGMTTHFWRKQGFQGLCYADNGIPNGWDNAQLQTSDDQAAGLSILLGGAKGINLGKGSVESQKNIYLPKWEQIYKGATANHNGKIARMHWPSYPFTLGSYICYRPGQYTTIAGAESMPIGHVFFAGEHCGGEFSGFMNGAAQSGRLAAEEIIAKTG
jgi:monoamine oxidase